jgi:UDP-N-acetylglucosamine 1-carboxyvinyltransferase
MSEMFVIRGGKPLHGVVQISGFKNAALPIIASTLLSKETCIIENVPLINDVFTLVDIMKEIGADANLSDEGVLTINAGAVEECNAIFDLTKRLRASYYLLGAGLGRFKKSVINYPGGCNIGTRPIDQHIKGFEGLGANVTISHGTIACQAEALVGDHIYMDVVSIGATINVMLASILAEGKTIIENPAKEPHVVDTANFLNSMGANVKGAGTDVIRIEGVKALKGCIYTVIPDQIEAGTYMIAAAATGGEILVKNIIPKHMEPVIAKLREAGVQVEEFDEAVRVTSTGKLKAIDVKTLPYPGFPTDLQQPITVMLTQAEGTSMITENIYEGRFKYIDELIKMGAEIKVDRRVAVVIGNGPLSGAKIEAMDLRAGAACVIAGLVASDETLVENIYHVDRGYEKVIDKLRALGADIERISSEPSQE